MNKRVRIARTDYDALYTAFDNRLGTRRLFACVTARFKCNVYIRTLNISSCVFYGVSLGVKRTVFFVEALADDLTVLNDYRAYKRIGVCKACAALCKLDCAAHIFFFHKKTASVIFGAEYEKPR